MISQVEEFANLKQGVDGDAGTRRQQVEALLGSRPELLNSPTKVARLLHIPAGTAKRVLGEIRESRRDNDFGPVLLQNVRIVTRTPPGTAYPGSPPPRWSDRGDNKLSRSVALPSDGRADIGWSGNGTLELSFAAPRGLSPSEILHSLAFVRELVPVDQDFEGTLSYEALRDGGSVRVEGAEAVTVRTFEGILAKAYNHSDSRGTAARVEVRSPPMKYSLREVEEMLLDARPVGRDGLADEIRELAAAVRRQGKETMFMRRALDKMR